MQPSLRPLGQTFPVAPTKDTYKHDLWSHNTQLFFFFVANKHVSKPEQSGSGTDARNSYPIDAGFKSRPLHRTLWSYLWGFFTFVWQCIIETNNIDNQLRCNNNGLLTIPISSTCFGQWFSPSSGTLDCVYSLWYNAPTMLSAGSLEAEFLRFQATDISRTNKEYCIINARCNYEDMSTVLEVRWVRDGTHMDI
jgi:hypothetical protein